MTFTRIFVGLDHSELSQEVFQQAVDLARACRAQLHLCHCVVMEAVPEPGPGSLAIGLPDFSPMMGMMDNPAWGELAQQQMEQTTQWLQHHAERAAQQDVKAEFSYVVGDPGSALCEQAKVWQADLMMVGRRGRQGLAEVFLGSISNHVVHHANCSVLVVQHPQD